MERIDVTNLPKISEEPRGHSVKYWIDQESPKIIKYNDPTCKDADVMESLSSTILHALNIPAISVELGYNQNQEYLDQMNIDDPKCCIIDSFLIRPGDTIHEIHPNWSRPNTKDEQKNISICFYKVFSMFDSLIGNEPENAENMKINYVRQVFGDCIVDNEDRRLNNIGVIYNEQDFTYRLAPSFDNALAFNLGGGEGYCYIGNQEFPVSSIIEYITRHYQPAICDIIQNLDNLVSSDLDSIISTYASEIPQDKLSYIYQTITETNELIQSKTNHNKPKRV